MLIEGILGKYSSLEDSLVLEEHTSEDIDTTLILRYWNQHDKSMIRGTVTVLFLQCLEMMVQSF